MPKEKTIFFPGLNGLRAIAAFAVVLSHITVELDTFFPKSVDYGHIDVDMDLADFGVTIFFALSGFLITYLLLAENKKKPIHIRNFYVRRILRIWPLYYAYFLIAMVLTIIWNDEYTASMTLCYIFFAANIPKIILQQIPLLSHYWSLGVEEQFYLMWPLAVKKNIHRLIPVTIGIIFLFLLVKAFAHQVFPGSHFESTMYVVKFDCMLIGAVGAMFYFNKNKWFMQIVPHVSAQIVAWIAILFVAINRFHILSIIDHEIISGITVVLIVGQIMAKRKIFNLDTSYFDFLGKISYGIYVIHPLALIILTKLMVNLSFGHHYIKYAVVYISVIGVTILLAHLSYQYLEKPFLRMKGRFSTVRSAGTKYYKEEEKEEASTEITPSPHSL